MWLNDRIGKRFLRGRRSGSGLRLLPQLLLVDLDQLVGLGGKLLALFDALPKRRLILFDIDQSLFDHFPARHLGAPRIPHSPNIDLDQWFRTPSEKLALSLSRHRAWEAAIHT